MDRILKAIVTVVAEDEGVWAETLEKVRGLRVSGTLSVEQD